MTLKYRIQREVIDQVCSSRCPVNSFRYVSFSISLWKNPFWVHMMLCSTTSDHRETRRATEVRSVSSSSSTSIPPTQRQRWFKLGWACFIFLYDSTAAYFHSRSCWFSLNFQKVFLIKIQNVIICHHSNIWMSLTKHCMLFVILILFMSGILVDGLL